ncbi:hypothetical protein [Megamonas funiformis]|uniref:hypothetical protein n=1 Tax=Megamonas funiformis TaxID=437897 RepID=UPI003520867F
MEQIVLNLRGIISLLSFPDTMLSVVTNRKDNGWGAVDGNSAGACDWNKTQVRIYSNDGTVPVNYIAIGK